MINLNDKYYKINLINFTDGSHICEAPSHSSPPTLTRDKRIYIGKINLDFSQYLQTQEDQIFYFELVKENGRENPPMSYPCGCLTCCLP